MSPIPPNNRTVVADRANDSRSSSIRERFDRPIAIGPLEPRLKELGDAKSGPTHNLFHERTNLRYGCLILRHYLDIERGDLFRALGRYNGSRGKPQYRHGDRGAVRARLRARLMPDAVR